MSRETVGWGEQYIPAQLRWFKYPKYGCHKEGCKGHQTCAKKTQTMLKKISQMPRLSIKSLHFLKILWHLSKRLVNSREETLKKGDLFEARRIVGSSMEENIYASVARRVDPTRQSNQVDQMIGQSFRGCWKTYNQLKFFEQKHKLN